MSEAIPEALLVEAVVILSEVIPEVHLSTILRKGILEISSRSRFSDDVDE